MTVFRSTVNTILLRLIHPCFYPCFYSASALRWIDVLVEFAMAVSMDRVNNMDYEEFIEIFGNVVEHCKICAAAVVSERPFKNRDYLREAMNGFMDVLPLEGKAAILRCHPDLAGKLAQHSQLTPESSREQKDAGLETLTVSEKQLLNTMNRRYKASFGFPFVICARQNKKAAIFKGLEDRLLNTKEAEILKGIEEVKKICFLRICEIATDETAKL